MILVMHISNKQKDRQLTRFNDCLKLATEAKLTVAGNEFHTFTILFAKNTDAQYCYI